MKKKTNIRDIREKNAQAKKSAYQQKDIELSRIQAEQEKARKAEEEEKKRKLEEERREAEERARIEQYLAQHGDQLNPVRIRTLSDEKKSTAKAAGLKSAFILNDRDLLMTSFGKGNQAIIEKKVENGIIEDIAPKPAFDMQAEKDERYLIDGRVKNASVDNPLHQNPENSKEQTGKRDDLIHARSALEKLYFEENFEDNIHIQAIYSILDIEKILTIHINNIIYMLNNMLREEQDNELIDIIGDLHASESYEKFLQSNDRNQWKAEAFKRLCRNKRLLYLNLQIVPDDSPQGQKGKEIKTDPNAVQLTEKEFYYILAAFSKMRNMLAHGDPKQNIYLLEGFGKNNVISDVLDRLYTDRIHELNSHFLDKAGKNLAILFKAFSVYSKEEKAAYARDYYDFTVQKTYKNTGFSIKSLREHMMTDIADALVLRDEKYNSVRGKLYPFTDFAIHRYYLLHQEESEALVNSLRASFDEKEKDKIYHKEAVRIWNRPEIGNLILYHILPEMSGESIKSLTPDKDVSSEMLESILVTSEATVFSKMIYLMTIFIDGKEINDLLTTLSHEFENIDAFLSVIRAQGLRTGFAKSFKLFGKSGTVAKELRIINSFARMTKASAKAKEPMYVEAFRILGMKNRSEEQLLHEASVILDPTISGAGTQNRGIRNFIANNVIESGRFKYLVRYGNVNKLKKLAENEAVIRFVLKDIPDDQIIRYFKNIGEVGNTDTEIMRKILGERLTGFSFEELRDVRQNDKIANQQEQENKKHKQALVRLYLAVLYLIIKNLVYINSRYYLAFHCTERDRMLLNPEKWSMADKHKYEDEYAYNIFAKEFFEQYPQKKRVNNYLQQNFANSDPWAIRTYRNKVEHLDAVRNASLYINDVKEIHSWFGLYHYIMQRTIMDQYAYDSQKESKHEASRMIIDDERLNPRTKEYFRKVEKYGSYCKDFVKALNTPFAYNLPRYKNLSIDELFDKNRPGSAGNGKTATIEPVDNAE